MKDVESSGYAKTALKIELVAERLAWALALTVTVPILFTAIILMVVFKISSFLFQNHFSKNSNMPTFSHEELDEPFADMSRKEMNQGGLLGLATSLFTAPEDFAASSKVISEVAIFKNRIETQVTEAKRKDTIANLAAEKKKFQLSAIVEGQSELIKQLKSLDRAINGAEQAFFDETVNINIKRQATSLFREMATSGESASSLIVTLPDNILPALSKVKRKQEKVKKSRNIIQQLEQSYVNREVVSPLVNSKLRSEVSALQAEKEKNLASIESLTRKAENREGYSSIDNRGEVSASFVSQNPKSNPSKKYLEKPNVLMPPPQLEGHRFSHGTHSRVVDSDEE